MTFLQPNILWGLPLLLVPVIIHLINRLRHKPQPWAAMQFLLAANRSSTSHAKLRQLLILLFRVLAVLALVLFIARPLAGGWLGWALSPAPDVIVLLLDRSASMETKLAGQTITKREQALKLLSQAAKEFQESSHLVLIESALRSPQQIATAATLSELSLTAATDTAADLPAMLATAFNWLVENRAGATEIWIASDLQRTDWRPDDERWKTVSAQLASLPQRVRIRLLAFNDDREPNASVTLQEIFRRPRGEQAELNLSLDFQRNITPPATLPLAVTLDGARAQAELAMDGQTLRWRHTLDLGAKKNGGWGSIALPADANPRDNTAFFVYGADTVLQAGIIATDLPSGRLLRLAASASGRGNKPVANTLSLATLDTASFADHTLIAWQGALPTGTAAARLKGFIEEGGAVIFFPPGQPDAAQFLGAGWGDVQSTPADKPFHITRWEEQEGPLAKTDEGLSLPLPDTEFLKRQAITGDKNVLAAFDDGAPFLMRRTLGRGQFFLCASLPRDDWSSLGEGPVIVPLVQRLLQAGARRLNQDTMVACGELNAADKGKQWTAVDSATPKDILTQAGVYRSGDRLLAVNRPATESEREQLEPDAARRLLGNIPFQLLQEKRSRADVLQGEIWRLFLLGMLLFLIVESILVLPDKRKIKTPMEQPALEAVA